MKGFFILSDHSGILEIDNKKNNETYTASWEKEIKISKSKMKTTYKNQYLHIEVIVFDKTTVFTIFNRTFIKISGTLFIEIEKSLQMHRETLKFKTAKAILNIKNYVGISPYLISNCTTESWK